MMNLLIERAKKSDELLSKKSGYTKNDITNLVESLFSFGKCEVGWRESCGSTDPTAYIRREWIKLVKFSNKKGIEFNIESVKHGNAYATSKGGFWKSEIYSIKQ